MSTVSAPVGEGRGLGGSLMGGGAGGVTGATTLFVLVMAVAIVQFGGNAQRVLLATSLGMSFYALMTFAPRLGIPTVLVFLNFLGLLRRYSVPLLGYSSMDALLLITPIATTLFFLNHLLNRQVPWDTRLSRYIGTLTVVMCVQVFNPFQGGPVLGLMGLMSFTVPLLWYYIGRAYGSRSLLYLVLNTLVVAGSISAAYGLWQTFFGFSDVEKEWLNITRTYVGQTIAGGFMRVFSTYSSFAEYTRILIVAACACLGLMRRNRLYVVPFLLFATCIVLSSSRGALLGLAAAAAFCWAVQGKTVRSWVPRLGIAAVLAAAAVVFGLSTASQSTQETEGPVGTIVSYQARGILNVTDKHESTAGGHVYLILGGIMSGIKNPIGTGIGAATVHAGAYSTHIVTTEADFSNMFASLGGFGGVLYLMCIGYSIHNTGLMWNRYRDPAVLSVFALLLTTLSGWLIAGQYVLPFVIWLSIGIVDTFIHYEEKRLGKPISIRRDLFGRRNLPPRGLLSPVSRQTAPSGGINRPSAPENLS